MCMQHQFDVYYVQTSQLIAVKFNVLQLMMVKRWPATVDEEKVPSPIILVNASNSYGHSTTCFSWALQGKVRV